MNKDEQKQRSPKKNKDNYSTDKEKIKTNHKFVYTKKHHDPKNTIKKSYKFGIPGTLSLKGKAKLRS